jgi:hypothetical protein
MVQIDLNGGDKKDGRASKPCHFFLWSPNGKVNRFP